MNHDQLTKHALKLLRGNESYIADAREGAPVGNSVVGSLLSFQFKVPRQHAEEAVADALTILDSSAAESIEKDGGGNYTLKRTGKPSLRFQGELLAQADGWQQNGCNQNRWHALTAYRTTGGKYVVSISYRTRWQGESDHDFAEVCSDAQSAAAVFQGYDAVEFVAGYPPGNAYAEKQARLIQDLTQRYAVLVSEVLADEAFAERID